MREYFCCGCGLFHWIDQYKTDETGRINYVRHQGCPNQFCISHKEKDVPIFAIDTMGWVYFCEGYKDFVDEVKWSSSKYAPEDVIEFYKQQGIPIED